MALLAALIAGERSGRGGRWRRRGVRSTDRRAPWPCMSAQGTSTDGDSKPTCSCCATASRSRRDSRRARRRQPAHLADRIAAETDGRVVVGCLRGVGASAGDFSLRGWYDDLEALVDHAAAIGRRRRGVAGRASAPAGRSALCVAAEDTRVRGVACFGSPATFADWANDGRRDDRVRPAGRRHPHGRAIPPTGGRGREAFTALRPDDAAGASGAPAACSSSTAPTTKRCPSPTGAVWPRSAGRHAELRVLSGAGHRLRADPRAVALLGGVARAAMTAIGVRDAVVSAQSVGPEEAWSMTVAQLAWAACRGRRCLGEVADDDEMAGPRGRTARARVGGDPARSRTPAAPSAATAKVM